MIRWLLLLLFFALAMIFGPVVANNPGYIKIVLAGYSLEMTALGLFLLVMLLFLALLFICTVVRKILRLKHISLNFFQWRRQRKAQQAFELGLQAFARQQWATASQYLQKAANDNFMSTEKRMLSSYASLYAGKQEQATEQAALLPSDDVNGWYVHADLLLRQGDVNEACSYLAEKIAVNPRDVGLGQLYIRALQQAGQWQQLLMTIPQALASHWFDKTQWPEQRFNIYPPALIQLTQQQKFDEQDDYWQDLPAKERKSSAAIVAQSWILANKGQPEQAEKLLASTLELNDLAQAWPYLRKIQLKHAVVRLRKKLQRWLHEHSTNGYLYALLAHLAEQEGEIVEANVLWHKAQQYQPDLKRSYD